MSDPSAGAPFDAFEQVLERAVDRLDARSPIRALVREHFAFGDPAAQRGKRLRPRLLAAVAQTEGARAGEVLTAGAAVELLHNFSLVHDDIEDRDELRHGRPALWARHGIPAALTAGDAMCALSFAVLADQNAPGGSPDRTAAMLVCLHRALRELCAGQGADIGFETSPTVTFEQYVAMIEGKTAALFGASCELGALAAGAGPERAAAYGRMGRAYGLAFQIRDDVLGTWGAPAQTGKPAGGDIRRRKWSFPVAWAYSGPPSADRDTIATAYASTRELSDAEATAVVGALERLGADVAADSACDDHIAQAVGLARAAALDRDGHLAGLFASTSRRTA